MKKYLMIIFLFLPSLLLAQAEISDILEVIAEQDREENVVDEELSEAAEHLNFLMDHPLNINQATEEQLGQIPFLTNKKITDLIKYRTDYGKIFTPYELSGIEGFDSVLIQKIIPFISFGEETDKHPVKLKNILKYGRSYFLLKYQRILEKQEGYGSSVSETQKYSGDPSKIYFRYQYNYYDRISFGLTGEKDAGEQFFGESQKYGFDYYSGYFSLSNTGIIKNLIIGNFKAFFGQGLTLGSGSAFGNIPGLTGMRFANGIRPSLSTDENDYLRGIAIVAGKKKINLSLFFSGHKRDGNIMSSDSVEKNLLITSLQETGYHRLPSEISDKGSVTERIAGGNLSFKSKFLRVGLTSFYSSWNAFINPEKKLYNVYTFRGKENLNTGMDFKFLIKNVYFYGEAAISKNGGTAYIAGFQSSPDPRVSIAGSFRNYSPKYQDLRSNAIGQNSSNSNEQGISLSLIMQLPKYLNLSASMDLYRIPYLRYGVNNPTSGTDFYLRVNYSRFRNLPMYVLIHGRNGETNLDSGHLKILEKTEKYNVRYQADWLLTDKITLKSRIEIVINRSLSKYQKGYLLSQTLSAKTNIRFISCYFLYAIFDTYSYNERIYLYETDVLYGYSVPGLSGKGLRTALMLTISPSAHIDFWIRYAATFYQDRNIIGSGSTEIMGNTTSDIRLQCRIKF